MCHFCTVHRRDLHLEDLAPIPPSARQPGGTQKPENVQMTGSQIQAYLQYVAKCMRDKRASVTVVGVGGVINTLVLGTRQSTHDVDIMCDGLSVGEASTLTDAIRKAAKKYKLDAHWLNNQTILHIPPSLRQSIRHDAAQQDFVIFNEPGLKMFAAPWMYSMASKLHRISGQGAGPVRQYDPADAANFLLQHLRATNRPSISLSEIKAWLTRYQIPIPDRALLTACQAVNTAAGKRIIVTER